MWDKFRKEPLKYSNITKMRRKRKKVSDRNKEIITAQISSRESFSEYSSKYQRHEVYI